MLQLRRLAGSVAGLLEGYGTRLNSAGILKREASTKLRLYARAAECLVALCDAGRQQEAELQEKVRARIHTTEQQVAAMRMGKQRTAPGFEGLDKHGGVEGAEG